ncbi:MAG: hypothetical protein CK427_16180 [Leptospira sp.]|nr:MAG: hypothetical protein CK427_16180 [Leptospira sp.]
MTSIDESKFNSLEEFVKALDKELISLYKDLRESGFNYIKKIDSGYNFTKEEQNELIPILLKHIQLDYHPRNKKTMALKLSTTKKLGRKEGWDIILNELKKTPPDEEISIPWRRGYKWALLSVISQMSQEEDIPIVIEILKDASHGQERLILANRISKSKNEDAKREVALMKDVPGFELEIARLQKKGRLPIV